MKLGFRFEAKPPPVLNVTVDERDRSALVGIDLPPDTPLQTIQRIAVAIGFTAEEASELPGRIEHVLAQNAARETP